MSQRRNHNVNYKIFELNDTAFSLSFSSKYFIIFVLKIYLYCFFGKLFCFYFLAAPCSIWDLSSPTRDRTLTPCTGSAESQPLDHQGSPLLYYYTCESQLKQCLERKLQL